MQDEASSRVEHKHRDISPDIFKDHAHKTVDWIAEYLENMNQYPVLASSRPGDLKARIPKSPPASSEPLERIMRDFQEIILPGITHWNHPRFFAYFSITSSYPGIIGEMLCSALNVNAMLWKTSPSATELEEVVTDWLRQMIGLPEQFDGVINDSASVSSLCALVAAREHTGLNIREDGLSGRNLPSLRIYTSEEAHSSIEKAAIVLGIGQRGVKKIRTDEAFRMDVKVLTQSVEDDIRRGIKPICIIPTIGTTSTTSIDPVKEISELCKRYGIWLHVDAAYGGSAATIEEMRPMFTGWESADSIVINPHKWLFTPIDCSILYCRRPNVLKQAFSLTPEYLQTAEADKVTNLMDYGVSLGRRFRALKLWMIIRALGADGIANIIREHISYAKRLEKIIQATPNFELLAPVPFSTLVFRFSPETPTRNDSELNTLNEKLMETVNRTGQVFLSHTKLRGKFGIRLTIGNIKTTWEDVALAWDIIQRRARELSDLRK
jgi:aromatic-L-amino-acid decarboxylase